MKTYRSLLLVLLLPLAACGEDYLVTEPQTILTDEQVWKSPSLITGVLANYYNRLPQVLGLDQGQYEDMAAYDEAMWSSGTGWENRNQLTNYAFNRWTLWDGGNAGSSYGLIRDINLAIENITAVQAASLPQTQKDQFLAELRFLRAYVYFEHVKRMGGVPIITEQLVYDFSGDSAAAKLRRPRNTEAEVYDFIAKEIDEIAGKLGNAASKTRANRYTALALKSRAMLYAASIARHNSEMPVPITLPGGEVGIPASRAVEYYTKSLEASRAILASGVYSLYRANANRGENFYEALAKKSGNNELIFIRDYSVSAGRRHQFTLQTIPRSQRLESPSGFGGSALSPTLNLVESFEYLDNSQGTLKGVGTGTVASQANWIFYNRIDDIFANKDPRLYGTVIYPGTTFAGRPISLQAGVYVWNVTANRYDRVEGARFTNYTDGGILTGEDGTVRNDTYTSSTGFLLRKFVDTAPQAPTQAVGSDIAWPFFRLGEIYLNAAEAAFELGLPTEAVGYVNTVRERAGFPANSLTSLDRNRIRNERRVELAFEDHRVWDLIRWRIADQVWNGQFNDPVAHPHVLFAYRIVRPGHANNGKYVFDKFPSTRITAPRFFRLGNYYSQIPEAVVSNNSLIVRNPFH